MMTRRRQAVKEVIDAWDMLLERDVQVTLSLSRVNVDRDAWMRMNTAINQLEDTHKSLWIRFIKFLDEVDDMHKGEQ